ncbi:MULTISPECIES: MoaD/ThiS family protein [unclassified Campylobacter]|uniref:MoaD/ThiS family protein n=1 Tax=unclassified Campylobacter TaxID=2593542 RepID=UPI001BDB57B9|nr:MULTISPECIES: MoaD/ThiS family protein [unclassified Campylobacter]MBZ7978130.1 MoaD/ThiS family protein [Campylobacter sp. RM12654]MBZ7983936.1 MoaD/ThiS family protein [Campylobacter sp. RM12647]MBZ7990514.1 MoaD/ThiS family protein [Campylobacter sp. RM9331]MBZ7992419.1 MoaD/ThiS family protein [Campylobacter sp. RM9333]MBZ8004847.1 MoaD/ThiS family protein [Campylobacter sp. RM9332]
MVKINFLGPINKNSIELNVKNVRELKNELLKIEDLKEWLEISAIAINDNFIDSLDIALKDNDVVSILPPVCGG